MAGGTALLLAQVDALDDAALEEPCRLPAWGRRHLVAHLAHNATALGNLLRWAQTGVETPMYSSQTQRNDDIARSATDAPDALRRDLAGTAAALDAHVREVTPQQWGATVRTAQGRDIPAAEVPWMRAREVWLHALDLGTGVSVAQLPDDFSETLIDDVLGFFAKAAGAPVLRLAAKGSGREWTLGDPAPAASIGGTPPALAAWLTGRSDGRDLDAAELPELPRWL
ncbi:maleylpyruvate isomerase family mycothiol-dependent enzyme [Rugosimonospora africana]|nr:maleylpyruvate isomerase family mycothiol-dependent enzyme [Rugosimonospora africana]